MLYYNLKLSHHARFYVMSIIVITERYVIEFCALRNPITQCLSFRIYTKSQIAYHKKGDERSILEQDIVDVLAPK